MSDDDITLPRNERIRRRAYQLWEAAGSPPDRQSQYWYEAESQIEAEDAAREQPPSRGS